MMKLEQDTVTKADIWLETSDFGDWWSTGKKVRDKWWMTHKREQAKEPDTTTKADDDWRKIYCETTGDW